MMFSRPFKSIRTSLIAYDHGYVCRERALLNMINDRLEIRTAA